MSDISFLMPDITKVNAMMKMTSLISHMSLGHYLTAMDFSLKSLYMTGYVANY
ncbi:MAG: hypothetical protein KAJ34_03640 [Thermodesulfovibrionia bacterium]|nr:hypothetical protein [Thermodesulfovibrionia bacterium]